MGLFSFGNKNKQETVRDSGHFVKDDDAAIGERARSKRASHAGEGARRGRGPDPVLPEKKRARRRLVGAIALALAAAVGLPMLLDSEPKPLAGDIAIHIPSKEKAAPLPVPAEPVPAAESVDSGEEIVDVPPDAPPPKAAPAAAEPPPVRTVETVKPDPVKPEPSKVEPKQEAAKPEPARKPEPEKRELDKKPAKPAEPKVAEKPRADDSARAMAILEDKPAVKAEGPAPRYVVQAAALGSQEKAAELQSRLRAAGVSSFTQKSGDLVRVRVGPFSKEEAEKIRAKLSGMGLSPTMLPL
ncbi:SPOR domain-containing protein [Massilia sp. DD77]|uniref:SPOR domain-containing protein n=1 Tax=Massilia sp. DD77 TaxID=3109349 RepID=UPI002FFE3D7F